MITHPPGLIPAVATHPVARAADLLFPRRWGRRLLPALASWQLERIAFTTVVDSCRRSTELVLNIATCTRRCR